jgi:hypothetical protein
MIHIQNNDVASISARNVSQKRRSVKCTHLRTIILISSMRMAQTAKPSSNVRVCIITLN